MRNNYSVSSLCFGLGFLFLELPLIKRFLFFFLLATLQDLFLSSLFGLFFPGILFFLFV